MKSAYPNFANDSDYVKPIYNLNKWLEAMRELYANLHYGKPYKEAFSAVTNQWDVVELRDFTAWLAYYQGNNQSKYKTAQLYVNENIPGYFLPNPTTKSEPRETFRPNIDQQVADTFARETQEKESKEEKRRQIEEQRKKIIGRLHSAVKLLTSPEGHLLAGAEFETLLSSMYDLIKQFQTINKVSLSAQIYTDLILRQANRLSHQGFSRSSSFLRKFAQNTQGGFPLGPIPTASATGNGVVGNLQNETPPSAFAPPPAGVSDPAPSVIPEEEEKPKDALHQLLDNLETSGLTDVNEDDDEELEISLSPDEEDELTVSAQLAPSSPLDTAPAEEDPIPSPSPLPVDEPQELTPEEPHKIAPLPAAEDDLEVSSPGNIPDPSSTDIDILIDRAFGNISIEDVIQKVEDISAIFQNRLITKELAIIELMLTKLGLSSFFSNLNEVQQKNYETYSYCTSRLSDILQKLRGAASKTNIDLVEEPKNMSPDMKRIQDHLQYDQDKERDRKEQRKNKENQELDEGNETLPEAPSVPSMAPEAPIGQEIGQTPTQIIQ